MKNDPHTLEDMATALTHWLRSRDDIRSVALVIDWVGSGNHDKENAASIWLDEHGKVPTGDALATVGTLQQTLKLMAHLVQEANASSRVILTDMEEWADRGRKMMNQIHDRRKTLEEAQAEESQLQERLEELRVHIRRREHELDELNTPATARGTAALRPRRLGNTDGSVAEDLDEGSREDGQTISDEADRGNDPRVPPEVSGDQEG